MVLWDANTQKEIHVFDSAHKAPGCGLAFSPASELLVVSVGLDKKIVCYDTASKMWDWYHAAMIFTLFESAEMNLLPTRSKIPWQWAIGTFKFQELKIPSTFVWKLFHLKKKRIDNNNTFC